MTEYIVYKLIYTAIECLLYLQPFIYSYTVYTVVVAQPLLVLVYSWYQFIIRIYNTYLFYYRINLLQHHSLTVSMPKAYQG